MHFFNFYISCVVLIWAFGKFAWSEDEENREERGLVGANVLGSPRGMQDHAAVKTDVGDTANVRVLPFQQPGRISQNARPVPAGHSAPYAPNNPEAVKDKFSAIYDKLTYPPPNPFTKAFTFSNALKTVINESNTTSNLNISSDPELDFVDTQESIIVSTISSLPKKSINSWLSTVYKNYFERKHTDLLKTRPKNPLKPLNIHFHRKREVAEITTDSNIMDTTCICDEDLSGNFNTLAHSTSVMTDATPDSSTNFVNSEINDNVNTIEIDLYLNSSSTHSIPITNTENNLNVTEGVTMSENLNSTTTHLSYNNETIPTENLINEGNALNNSYQYIEGAVEETTCICDEDLSGNFNTLANSTSDMIDTLFENAGFDSSTSFATSEIYDAITNTVQADLFSNFPSILTTSPKPNILNFITSLNTIATIENSLNVTDVNILNENMTNVTIHLLDSNLKITTEHITNEGNTYDSSSNNIVSESIGNQHNLENIYYDNHLEISSELNSEHKSLKIQTPIEELLASSGVPTNFTTEFQTIMTTQSSIIDDALTDTTLQMGLLSTTETIISTVSSTIFYSTQNINEMTVVNDESEEHDCNDEIDNCKEHAIENFQTSENSKKPDLSDFTLATKTDESATYSDIRPISSTESQSLHFDEISLTPIAENSNFSHPFFETSPLPETELITDSDEIEFCDNIDESSTISRHSLCGATESVSNTLFENIDNNSTQILNTNSNTPVTNLDTENIIVNTSSNYLDIASSTISTAEFEIAIENVNSSLGSTISNISIAITTIILHENDIENFSGSLDSTTNIELDNANRSLDSVTFTTNFEFENSHYSLNEAALTTSKTPKTAFGFEGISSSLVLNTLTTDFKFENDTENTSDSLNNTTPTVTTNFDIENNNNSFVNETSIISSTPTNNASGTPTISANNNDIVSQFNDFSSTLESELEVTTTQTKLTMKPSTFRSFWQFVTKAAFTSPTYKNFLTTTAHNSHAYPIQPMYTTNSFKRNQFNNNYYQLYNNNSNYYFHTKPIYKPLYHNFPTAGAFNNVTSNIKYAYNDDPNNTLKKNKFKNSQSITTPLYSYLELLYAQQTLSKLANTQRKSDLSQYPLPNYFNNQPITENIQSQISNLKNYNSGYKSYFNQPLINNNQHNQFHKGNIQSYVPSTGIGPPPTYSNKHPYRGNQVPKYQQSAVNPGYQHQTHLYQPPPHPHYSAHQPYRGPPMAPPHYAQPIPVKQQGYQVPQHAHPQYAQPALVTQRPQYIPQPIHHPTQIQYYKQPPPQTYVNRPAYAPQVLPIYTTRPYVSQPTQHPPYVFQPTNYPPHKIQQAQHQPYATHPGHPLYAPQPPRYVPNATHYPTQHPSLNILPPVIQHRPAYAPQQTQPVPYKIPPNYGPVPIRQPIVYDPSLDPSVTIVPVTISLSTTPTVNKIVTVGTEPTELEPVDTEPTELEPVDTEPTELEPVDTEPNKLKPVEAEPEPEKTKPTELKPVETDATELEPVEVEPTKLEPVEVEPTKLEPVEVEPTELEPVEVEPTEPEPVEVEPTHPESVKAEPNEVKAIESEPIELLGRNPHLPINKETSLPKFPFSIPKSSNQNIPIKPDLDTHNDKHNANLEKTHHNSLINSDRSSSSEISLDSDSSSEHDSSSDSDSSSDEEKENLSYSHHHCNNYPNKLHRKPFYYYRGLNDFFKMLYSNNYNSNYYPYNKNFYKDLKTSNHHNHYKPTQYNPFYSSKYIINPLDNNSEASIYNYNKFYFTNEPKNNNKNGFDLYKILKNVKHLHDCTLNTFSNESAESFETCDNGTNSQSINKTFNESMSEQNCSTLNKNSLHVHSIDDIVLISNKYPTFTSYSLLPDEQVQQNLFIYIPIALLNCDSHIFKTFNAENKKPFPQARPLLLHGQILCPMPIHPPFKLLFHTQEEAVNYRNKPNYYGDYQIPNNIYSKPVNNFQYKVFPGNHFYSTQHKHDTIETNPYDEEQQKIIQEDYIVPPSSNYNPLTNNDDLSRDNYYPPSDNYDSPSDTYNVHADDTDLSRENYESPKNNLVPPSENCDPPSNEYDSSSDNYDPSKDSYNSPSNNYNPIADNNDSSRDNFGTLADNYDSLTNNYSPPRDNYNPINDNNDSFKDNYEPHDGNYDVSNAKYDAPRDNYESPQNPNPEFYHVPILETSNDNSKQDSFELPLEKHTQKTFVDKNPKVIIKPTVTTKLIGQHAKLPNKEQLHTTKEHLPDTKESTYTTQKQKSGHSNYYNNLPSSIKYQAEYDYTKSNSDTSYFSYYDHDKASSGDHNYYFESANTKPDNEYSDYNIDNLPLDDDYKEFSHPPPRYSYPNVPAYYSQYQTDYEDQLNYNDGFANIEYDTYSYDYYANYDEYNEQYSPTKYHYRPNYPEYPKPQLPPQRKLGDYTHSNNRDMFERLSSYVQDKFSDILDSFEDKTYYK